VNPLLEDVPDNTLKKHHQWVMLVRKHAQVMVDDEAKILKLYKQEGEK